MTIVPLRYPPDLTDDARNIPYVKLKMVKYRERNFVVEDGRFTDISTVEKPLGNIILPLPESVQNSVNLNWEMANLQGVKLLEGIFQGTGFADRAESVFQDAPAILFDQISKIAAQKTPNPKKQALFNGIDPRSFTFTYLFAPQSLKEAETLEKLIKTLTVNALPALESVDEDGNIQDDPNAAFFKFPAEFLISFHNVEGFPKFKACVCTNISTNYSPNSIQLLESGHSVQIALSLSFLETELLRRSTPGI